MKNTGGENQWCPFQPSATDLEAISKDVAEIPDIQLLANDAGLKLPDHVAHQYQIANKTASGNRRANLVWQERSHTKRARKAAVL